MFSPFLGKVGDPSEKDSKVSTCGANVLNDDKGELVYDDSLQAPT